jgi:hypothetical protein
MKEPEGWAFGVRKDSYLRPGHYHEGPNAKINGL